MGSRRPSVRVPPAARIDLFLIRLAPAAVFLVHVYLKLFGGYHDRTVALFLTVNIPFAKQAAWIVGGLELAGGLALLTGVLIRPLALLLAMEMAVAITNGANGPAFRGRGGSLSSLCCLSVWGLRFGESRTEESKAEACENHPLRARLAHFFSETASVVKSDTAWPRSLALLFVPSPTLA